MLATDLLYLILVAMFSIAVLVATAIFLAGALHIEPQFRAVISGITPAILLGGLSIGILFSGRNASYYGINGHFNLDSSTAISGWILRCTTAIAVVTSGIIIVSAALRKQHWSHKSKFLFISFCGYFFFTYVVSGALGTAPSLTHKTFYPLIIIFALFVTSNERENRILRPARDTLFAFLLVGLILIPIMPDLVRQEGYTGVIPGLSFRYWGLASHANNIGPLALFFLLLLCWLPYRSRLAILISTVVAGTTIALSQSKTTYIAAVAVITVFLTYQWLLIFRRDKFHISRAIIAIFVPIAFLLFMLIVVAGDIYAEPYERLISTISERQSLLTGRELIWAITLKEWAQSPLFGYGPTLWGEEFSAKYGYSGIASNAHNQILDTIGSAGYFGVASLIIYLIVLTYYAFKLTKQSRGISLALLTFLMLRCVTEVPLKTVNITTSDFFMHAITIGVFMRAIQGKKEFVSLECNKHPIRPS